MGAQEEKRARYLTNGAGFNLKLSAVPAHVFRHERTRALDRSTPTSVIPLDLSEVLETSWPATTPTVLARYLRINRGEQLPTAFQASGQICYVVSGAGTTRVGGEVLEWNAGDVFCTPSAERVEHFAPKEDAVLFVATDEPLLAFMNVQPGPTTVPLVHFPGSEVERRLRELNGIGDARVNERAPTERRRGRAIAFGHDGLESRRTALPCHAAYMNSLLPAEAQLAHRHNSVAVTLVVRADRCFSIVGDKRVDWVENEVIVTPPAELHSHHNEGRDLARFFIIQDGGLYYYCRTMGLSSA